jgi:O-glycosyl hydrolase
VLLKRRLESAGYSTKGSAPDDVVDELGAPITNVIMANAEARSFIKALSIHLYGDLTPTAMAGLAKQYGVPLWMTEFSDRVGGLETGWASLIHDLIVTFDCAAVDMLAPFLGTNAPSNPSSAYITLRSTGSAYEGYTLNPSYFQTGHWSKFVPRGSRRVDASSTNSEVKVSAFTRNGKRVIVLIHTGDGPISVAIPSGTFRLFQTQLSGTDRLTDKGLFATAVMLSRRSITTLVEN